MDLSLLKRARGGDIDALGELLRKSEAALKATMERAIPARHQASLSADDVVHETYVRVLVGLEQFRGETDLSFRSWVHSISQRMLTQSIRSLEAKKRGGAFRRFYSDGASPNTLLDQVLVDSFTASRTFALDEAHQIVKKGLARLPTLYRDVIQAFLDERSLDEVARDLDRSKGAVLMLRSRAFAELQAVVREIAGTSL